jgi:cell wall assembly regulator SMI1
MWLDANVPAGYGKLRPGVSAAAIRVAEKTMGLKLPNDVKASYRIHDGQGMEPGLVGGEGWMLLSLQNIVKVWRRWSRSNPKHAHFCADRRRTSRSTRLGPHFGFARHEDVAAALSGFFICAHREFIVLQSPSSRTSPMEAGI